MKPISVKKYRKAVAAGKLKDPLIFLDSIMEGQDLRRGSALYELVAGIHGLPDEDDWQQIVRLVVRYHKYEAVRVADSMRAAERLAEYLHPKVKTEDKGTTTQQVEVAPLTEEEILMFKEHWNDEY